MHWPGASVSGVFLLKTPMRVERVILPSVHAVDVDDVEDVVLDEAPAEVVETTGVKSACVRPHSPRVQQPDRPKVVPDTRLSWLPALVELVVDVEVDVEEVDVVVQPSDWTVRLPLRPI